MTRRRGYILIIFAFACLLLGAAANVAMTWWIASRAEPFSIDRGFGFSHPGAEGWFVRRADDEIGSVRLAGKSASAWQSSGVSREVMSLVPAWSRFRSPPDDDHPQEIIEHGRGWPVISFSCAFIDTTPAQQRGWGRPRAYSIIDGIELEVNRAAQLQMNRTMWSAMDEPPAMPTRIHWPGMITNTLFYSAVAAIPLLVMVFTWKGAGAARRWRRRRCGRCINCGYDLRGHKDQALDGGAGGCPECGWARPHSA